mmetsp:Transcript_32245/g.97175  ORF Transcript_32245/g.97175 Transcript_32245/m.97175 type:complete len:324 (+) Transcript_32245:1212-2183(+)
MHRDVGPGVFGKHRGAEGVEAGVRDGDGLDVVPTHRRVGFGDALDGNAGQQQVPRTTDRGLGSTVPEPFTSKTDEKVGLTAGLIRHNHVKPFELGQVSRARDNHHNLRHRGGSSGGGSGGCVCRRRGCGRPRRRLGRRRSRRRRRRLGCRRLGRLSGRCILIVRAVGGGGRLELGAIPRDHFAHTGHLAWREACHAGVAGVVHEAPRGVFAWILGARIPSAAAVVRGSFKGGVVHLVVNRRVAHPVLGRKRVQQAHVVPHLVHQSVAQVQVVVRAPRHSVWVDQDHLILGPFRVLPRQVGPSEVAISLAREDVDDGGVGPGVL